MNNMPISYEEYILMDREYRDKVEYIIDKYMEVTKYMTFDRDDIDYPPMWEPGL